MPRRKREPGQKHVQDLLKEYREVVEGLESLHSLGERAERLAEGTQALAALPLFSDLEDNLTILKDLWEDCADAVFREFTTSGGRPAALLYIDGLVNKDQVEQDVLQPLLIYVREDELAPPPARETVLESLVKRRLPVAKFSHVGTVGDLLNRVLAGETALLLDGHPEALLIDVRGWERRGIEEPQAESVIRGPREGFTETLQTNTALLRRKIRSTHLKFELLKVGRLTLTGVTVAYIKGVASPQMVEEVRRRIGRIDVDGILESGYIEQFIEDSPYSPFPQVQYSERPDTVAAQLLEGRVAIFTEGTPMVLVVPATLWQLLQASEDYYERFYVGTVLRWLRFLFVIVALSLPSFYIAITTYHQEMLPTPLLLTIAASREGIPFPAFVEALIMEVTFEILREAGIRLPRQVGQAVNVVGALVIGQAAVTAGIVSAPLVLIIAITGIASFAIPHFNLALAFRLLRFLIMVLAASLGLYGIMIAFMAIIIHLTALRSFGVPYMSPVAPLSVGDLKDVLVRAPWWAMFLRPRLVGYRHPQRQDYPTKPVPPHRDEGDGS